MIESSQKAGVTRKYGNASSQFGRTTSHRAALSVMGQHSAEHTVQLVGMSERLNKVKLVKKPKVEILNLLS